MIWGIKSHQITGQNQAKILFDKMKVFLFAVGFVSSMATDKNATVFGNNLCYDCYGEDGPDANLKPEGGYWGTDCFDESKA